MNTIRSIAIAIVFLLSALIPSVNVEGSNDKRTEYDMGYLSEKWHTGMGTSLGGLNSIKSADIDIDGEDELIFGNSQGFVHVLDWNSSANAFTEVFQSIDLGGTIKGMEIAQIDDDPQLEIAIGYNWNGDIGKVKIIDGISLLAEANWSSGISWSHTQWTEGWPYGVAMGDLDGDNQTELAVGGDRGYLWVVETETPEKYVGRDITSDEAEWYMDVGAKTAGNTVENVWGLTFGQFDSDAAIEVAVGSKQGWVGVFDGQTEELQWKYDMDQSSNTDSLCYSLIAADLNGNDIDELVVPQQSKLTVFVDGGGDGGEEGDENYQKPDLSTIVEETDVNSGYGLANEDLGGNSNEELIVADNNGNIRIMGLVGSNLDTYTEWYGGTPMNVGGGVTVSMNGHDHPWIIHGGDTGILVGWEVNADDLQNIDHTLVWRTDSQYNGNQNLFSLEGGNTFGVAMGEIDGDDSSLELLVGSGSGRVYAFDGADYSSEWVSEPLEKLPIGIAVANLDGDADNEIVVTTGLPAEPKVGGEGGEGYLYIFDKSAGSSGTNFEQVYQSGDIGAALSVTVSELDGSAYPEIAIATGYKEVTDPTAGTAELHGHVRIYGWNGNDYVSEWNSGNLGEIAGSIASGDLVSGGDNEIAIGTGGKYLDSDDDPGQIIVYQKSGTGYSTHGTNIDTGRYQAYGLAIADADDDGDSEIIVGTGEYGDEKPRLAIYNGYSRAEEFSKKVDTTSVWGISADDVDGDNATEIIYGTAAGQIFLFEANEINEASTSGLSTKCGHYGGIAIGNSNKQGPKEILIGSTSYMWLFTTSDQANKPDLAITGSEISYSPENPNEDDDITISVTVHNYGGVALSEWSVLITDGDPNVGGWKFISNFFSDKDNESHAIEPGENYTFQRTWYGMNTEPGYHEIYATVADESQPMQETRYGNNKGFMVIENIIEIANDYPVAHAIADNNLVWKDEAIRINAGTSYDNETTDGDADMIDENADLTYSFNTDGGSKTQTLEPWICDVTFDEPGNKTITVTVSDERGKESTPFSIDITVKANTAPEAILSSNISGTIELLTDFGFITFDVSQSNDPDGRAELEYRFAFGNGINSDWVKSGGTVWLYKNALFTGSNGGDYNEGSGESVVDEYGTKRVFRLVNGQLLEIVEGKLTERGYNYSLPAGVDDAHYDASIYAREIGNSEDDIKYAISEKLKIHVYRPENELPIARAQAGILIESVVVFNDLVDKAVTGDEVTYTAAESTDPDGDDAKLTFEWVIKDSQNKEVALLDDKYAKTFTRTWNEPGTYIATVTVTDERGGSSTWQVEVRVSKSADYQLSEAEDDEGFSTGTLVGGAIASVLGLVGGAMALRRMGGGGEGVDDMLEDMAPGPVELQCPSCGGLISITTTQRPIQIGCPICASQFVIRE